MKLPTGEYYLAKNHSTGLGHFVFRASANNTNANGMISLNNASVPAELMGKNVLFRIEIQGDKH